MAGHSAVAKKSKFCSLRMDKCPCGNEYRDIMKGTESWGKYKQKHRIRISIERSPEAHHVLPVASVTANITANEKISDEVVKNTEWCVNDEPNMIALPLFEMTFTHYLIAPDENSNNSVIPAPPFAGLPMHNYGHAGFQKEVNSELKQVGKAAEENTKKHEEASKELREALNDTRSDFMSELNERGERKKGTHIEFLNAMGVNGDGTEFLGDTKDWYIPFSMEEDPSSRAFPSGVRKSGLSKKLNNLIKAMNDWSSAT